MNKKELETGMTLEFKNGRKAVVYLGHNYGDIIIFSNQSYTSLDCMTSTLKDADTSSQFDYECIAVYRPYKQMVLHGEHRAKPCWSREAPPTELTIAEIEEKLGYTIKVVK